MAMRNRLLLVAFLSLVFAHVPGIVAAATVVEDGVVAYKAWRHYGPYDASAGVITVKMTGTNNADLYVKKGAQPTLTSWDCRPYKSNSNEQCSLMGPGQIYVSVRGRSTSASTFHLVTTYQPSSSPIPAAKILLLASGYYEQESDIYYHLLGEGYDVDVAPGSLIKSTTDLSPYFLVIVTGFDTSLSSTGVARIESSAIPVLIMEYWDFWYSYEFGLLQWESGDYYGTSTVQIIDGTHPITEVFPASIQVYETPYTLYGAYIPSLEVGVAPLIYSLPTANEAAVIVDDERRIAASGIYDTTRYTATAWELFDRMIAWLQPVSVETLWSKSPPNMSIFVNVVSVPSGGYLATTSFGDVYRISDVGVSTLLLAGPGKVPSYSVRLNSAGTGYVIAYDEHFSTFDANGTLLGSVSSEFARYALPVTGSNNVYIPILDGDIGDGESDIPVIGGRVVDASGVIQFQFAADGNAGVTSTPTRLVYVTSTGLTARDMSGGVVWTSSLGVQSYDVCEDATKIVVEDRSNTHRVLHLEDGVQTNATDLGEAIWNVAISPSGEYSAATTKQGVHIFRNEVLQVSRVLPVTYAVSLDISDYGEAAIGGKNSDGTPHLMLVNRLGMIIWEEEGATADNYGWRPEVVIQASGEQISARMKSGIDFFQIERGL
jgi:hypothetical protein